MHNLFFNLLMIIPTLQKEYILYYIYDIDINDIDVNHV